MCRHIRKTARALDLARPWLMVLGTVAVASLVLGRSTTTESRVLMLDTKKRALDAVLAAPDPVPYPGYQHVRDKRLRDRPFLPYPLKPEIAHMNRKPFCKSTGHFGVKAVRAICVKLANRLSDCGSDCLRRKFTQFCD